MPVYTPPALNAVNFALTAQTPANIDPYETTLASYTVPALNAVNFALSVYTLPTFNRIIFELLGGTAYTVNLSDTVTLNDLFSGVLNPVGPQPILIRVYRWFWVKIYVARLEGRNVYRIKIFD